MTCKELVESASDYLDQQLDRPTCLKIEEHLNECLDCQNFMQKIYFSQEIMHTLKDNHGIEPTELAARLAKVRQKTSG